MSSNINFSRKKMMTINAEDRCEVKDIKAENVINFPDGIVGFEQLKNFVILLNDKVAPFMFMQSLDDTQINFVCIETFLVKPDYSFKIPDNTVARLGIEQTNDVLLLSIATIKPDAKESTANLLSPIVVNMKNMQAEQVILDSSNYPVKYRIWDNIEKKEPHEAVTA